MRYAHLALLALASLAARTPLAAQPQRATRARPHVVELTIADAQAAMRAKRLTCHALVRAYLDRIEAYDKRGPAINSIVDVNPGALAVADSLDRATASGAKTGSLHCVPLIVKANMETVELPTTAGSLALQGMRTGRDAFLVGRARAAGAIVLAKSNMAELAFSPYETVSSILPGYTHNPYALDRVTAGSSGGTAAAVASSFGLVGLGTDTGNSIRGPSSHQALVGIRSTMGLTSRAGVVPLFLAADIAGPMARTVADAVAVFQAIVGEDPDDSVTARVQARAIPDYSASLVKDGLRGARIGVLHQAYETPTTDSEIVRVFGRALNDLRAAGATIVDPVAVDSLDAWLSAPSNGVCNPFKWDFERYIAPLGDKAPVKTVDAILKSGKYHPSIQKRLEQARDAQLAPEENPACAARDVFRAKLRTAVTALMDSLKLDALVYPSWSNPPRLIGDLNTPAGDNNQLFSPSTGFPAITVPMGWTRENRLPAGLQFFGRAWDEARLIKLAYAYEQKTKWRRPPASVRELE